MKLYVIRHGQTSWNVEGRIQGQVDIDLNENGVELARRTASGIKDLPIDLIITSPFARAKNTALLATAGRDIPIIEDVRLAEMAFGEWEGQYNDNRDHVLCDDFLKTLREDIFSLNPPGGENVRDVIRRTGDFLKELGEDPSLADSNIMISSHGIASRALLYNFNENQNSRNFWITSVPPNCSITTVDYTNGKGKILEFDKLYAHLDTTEKDAWSRS